MRICDIPKTMHIAERTLMKGKRPMTLLFEGPPGTGKSAVSTHTVETEMNRVVITWMCGSRDLVDGRGVPFRVENETVFCPVADVPTMTSRITQKILDQGKLPGLFLDELPDAQPTLIPMLNGIINDHKAGDFPLHPQTLKWAAGNRAKDMASAKPMRTHTINRICRLEVVPEFRHPAYPGEETDLTFVLTHGRRQGWDDLTMAFLKTHPEEAFVFDPKAIQTGQDINFPSIRSWEAVSEIRLQAESMAVPSALLAEMVDGCVGRRAGAKFANYLAVKNDLVPFNEIVRDPEGAKIPNGSAARYAMATIAATHTTEASVRQVIKYMTRWPAEFGMSFVQDLEARFGRSVLDIREVRDLYTKAGVAYQTIAKFNNN